VHVLLGWGGVTGISLTRIPPFLGDFVRNLEIELGPIDGLPRNCLTADARD